MILAKSELGNYFQNTYINKLVLTLLYVIIHLCVFSHVEFPIGFLPDFTERFAFTFLFGFPKDGICCSLAFHYSD